MIANKIVSIEEQEDGTYVFPAVDLEQFNHSWAIYVWPDGSADVYTRRGATGNLLGKPLKLKAPTKRGPCDHDLQQEKLVGDNTFLCRKCTKLFRRIRKGRPGVPAIYAERVRTR
jgi:hypothetical protein